MTVRNILQLPDSSLRQQASAVSAFNGTLKTLADDHLDTTRSAPGLGITGPHTSEPRRITFLTLPLSNVRVADEKSTGRPRSGLDTIIAAIAAANGRIVITDNERDFGGIDIVNQIRGTS
jgi:hypothetical protein